MNKVIIFTIVLAILLVGGVLAFKSLESIKKSRNPASNIEDNSEAQTDWSINSFNEMIKLT